MKQFLKSTEFKIFITFFLSTTCISLTSRANGDYGIIHGMLGDIVINGVILVSSFFYAMDLAYYDSSKIFVKHGSRVAFRGILLTFFPAILAIQSGNYYNLLLAFYAYTVFYIFFELFYNNYRNDYPFYIGETAIHDKIVRWINRNSMFMMDLFPGWYIAWKLALFVLATVLLSIYWY
jgi:hypothetical protein